MNVEIERLKGKVESLERRVSNTEGLCTNLTEMAKSMERMATEMEYVRKDVNEIKKDNDSMQNQLNRHEQHSIGVKADKYDYYIKEIIKWLLILILGATIGKVID